MQRFSSPLLHPTSRRSPSVYCRGSIMAKTAALLLLLAVAASQVDLSLSLTTIVGSGDVDISACPITFYGRTYSMLHVLFTEATVEFCFKNSPSETAQDCVSVEDRQGQNKMHVNVQSVSISPPSPFHQAPNFRTPSVCNIEAVIADNNYRLYWICYIVSFGTQTALIVSAQHIYYETDFIVKTKVGEILMSTQTYGMDQMTLTSPGFFMDLSGCRVSDAILAASTSLIIPETCSNINCDESAVLSTVSTCGPQGVCQGNNRCGSLLHDVCTVTGSTVIDIFSRVHSVPDRCVYSLMRPQGSSDFNLLAGFQERRRQDVTFLDHLILWLGAPGVNIYLEQGGRVRVDDQILTLSTTAQLVYGVELSKDHTGVTAKIPFSNVTVFFDGNTAHVTGLIEHVEGLCGSTSNQTTTPSAEKSSSYSAAGCEIQQNDTFDSTIDCSRATEQCNLMRQAPFTACHNHTDPEPYITACTNTLCKYPAVDNLNCQFLEAYAESCNLKSNITLENWRSNAGCSAVPQAFCQDQYCSAHEFCGVKLSGDTRCFCRAIFASKYTQTNTLGEPTVCMQNSATLTLAGCLLEDKGIEYSLLHLNDHNCKGHMDSQTHMVTFSYDSNDTCGAEVMSNDSQVIYNNTIRMGNSSGYSLITRDDQIEIDFSCFYVQPDIKSMAFKIKDGSVVQQIVSGVWNYTLMMIAYADPNHMDLVGSDTEIRLNQKIWVELKTEGLDDTMVAVVTDSCWATNQPSPTSDLRYDLIINGCPNPADNTVEVEGNGLGTSNYFSFNMFEFSGESSEIYLHCKLELCAHQDISCAPNCGGGGLRKRRSSWPKHADQNPALITMAWSY